MATRRTMMPSALKLDVTPDKIIKSVDNPVGRKITAEIFDAFLSKINCGTRPQLNGNQKILPSRPVIQFIF